MAKLPPQAKKVFSGEIFDVYQWEQELYDGSTATFERLDRANTLQVIATVGDKILINFEEQPSLGSFYTLPGGRQEPGEEELFGIKRELQEEAGMTSKSWSELFRFDVSGKIDWEIIVFLAKECEKKYMTNPDAGEKIQTRLVSFEEFVEIVLSDEYRGVHLAHELLKMKDAGTLSDFKTALFS